MSWAVYISGPGLVGSPLIRDENNRPLIFDVEADAATFGVKMKAARPYHFITVREYVEGDEDRGWGASHPDGTT
jgi:hypothetical protein